MKLKIYDEYYKIKVYDKCDSCEKITKLDQIVAEEIAGEYICDCGYTQKKLLDKIN